MTAPTPDLPDWTRTSAVIDSPQLIIDTGGAVPMPYDSPLVDVSRFRSVRIIPNVSGGAAGQFASIVTTWQQDAELSPMDSYQVWDIASGVFAPNPPVIYLPVRGNGLQLSATQFGGTSKVNARAYGSLLDLPAPVVGGLRTPQPGLLAYDSYTALAVGSTVSYYCGPTPGDVWLVLSVSTGTINLALFGEIQTAIANVEVFLGQLVVTGSAESAVRVGAPAMALRVQVKNSGTVAAAASFAVTEAH